MITEDDRNLIARSRELGPALRASSSDRERLAGWLLKELADRLAGETDDAPVAVQEPRSAYFAGMREADMALDDALAAVRAEQDAGRITAAQAAAERIELMERHMAECRTLRRELGR